MKTQNCLKGYSYKSISSLVLAFFIITMAFSCKKNTPVKPEKKIPTPSINVTAELNGSSAGSTSKSTGTLSAIYSKDNKTLTYNLRFATVEPVNISLGTEANSINFVPTLPKDGAKYASPLIGKVVLDAKAEEALLADKVFINITSTKFSTGEIRGKLSIAKK